MPRSARGVPSHRANLATGRTGRGASRPAAGVVRPFVAQAAPQPVRPGPRPGRGGIRGAVLRVVRPLHPSGSTPGSVPPFGRSDGAGPATAGEARKMDHASVSRIRTGLTLLLAAVTLAAATPAAVGATTPLPSRAPANGSADPDGTRRTGSAWLPYWGDTEEAFQDALQHADQLHTVSPFWYEASAATVKSHPGSRVDPRDRRAARGRHQGGAHGDRDPRGR